MTVGQKKALVFAGFSIFGVFLAYAAYSLYTQVLLVQNMVVKFARASLLPINGSEVGLSITLNIENKSNLNINVNEVNFDIYVNGKYISKILQNINQNILPTAISPIQFNVYVNLGEILAGSDLVDFLSTLNMSTLNLKIDGYVSGSVDGINIKNYPFTLEDTVAHLTSS